MNVLERLAKFEKVFKERMSLAKHLLSNIIKSKREKRKYWKELKYFKLALRRLQDEGVATQNYMVKHVQSLVTLGIRDVFGKDGYDFVMEVRCTDRAMSVDFFLERDGELFDPLECCSYGVVDVMCFCLRIAIWSIVPGRRTMIFDEPFKNVSKEYRKKLGAFVRKISEQMDFQFIISTHMEELRDAAHKNFHLVKKGKESALCKQ